MERWTSKWQVMLVVLCVFLVVPGILARDFSTRGEAREALVTQSMTITGLRALGEGYGGAVPSKPPLLHWTGALFSKLTGGVTEATVRAPSVVACIIAVVAFAGFVGKLYGSSRGLMVGVMLLSTIEWFRHSIAARVDLLLSALILGNLLSMFLWIQAGCRRVPIIGVLCGVLGVLTKGPVAAVLPAGIVALYVLASKQARKTCMLTRPLGAYAAVFLISALWYLAAFLEGGDRFVSKVWYENVARFAGTQDDEPHSGTVIELWAAGLVGLLPWSLTLLPALRHLVVRMGLVRSGGDRDAIPQKTWRERAGELGAGARSWWLSLDEFSRFSLIVVLSYLIFFAIPGSKRSVYLLPAYPFAISLIAHSLASSQRSLAWLVRSVSAVGVSGILILVFPAFYGVSSISAWITSWPLSPKALIEVEHYLSLTPQLMHGAGSLITLLAAIVLSIGLVRGRIPGIETWAMTSWRSLAIVWGMLLFYGNTLVYPVVSNSLSARPFADSIRRIAALDRLYSFEPSFYSLSYYLGRPIYRLEENGEGLAQGESLVVVVNEEDLQDLGGYVDVKEIIARSDGPITKPQDRVLLVRGAWKGIVIIE